jgi:sulfate adenylyltransferase
LTGPLPSYHDVPTLAYTFTHHEPWPHSASHLTCSPPHVSSQVKKLSGTKFRAMLRAGDEIPEWFAFKSVVDVLRAEWK